jgi:pyruvate/2-oxoglutarate dehydrogenase complex dihydrolipoamide dehydrogenase (E3) component
MINDGELGGLCILRGCMPTKSMLAAAHAVHEAEHLEPFGATLEGRVVPDFERIMERKDGHVARFQRAKIAGVEAQDYDVLFGRARFTAEGRVAVNGSELSARRYVIATGSVPVMLPLPGLDRVPVLTSDEVMRLREQPASLLVQGAGPIGLELAQFFARVGTRVVLVNRSCCLSKLDAECGEELTRALEREPRFDLVTPGTIEELRERGSGLVARVRGPEGVREVEADALLMAAGRRAALDDLGLEHVGLSVENDRLAHDETMRTGNPDIFVAGDATGCHQILHVANQEGRVAGHNAAVGQPRRSMDRRVGMQMVFCDPPFAQVGHSEASARAEGLDVVVGRARFPETGRAITMGAQDGLWKIVAARDGGEILGSSILGPRADDLAHLISLAMVKRVTVDEILDMPWYHPTLSEVILGIARDIRRQL